MDSVWLGKYRGPKTHSVTTQNTMCSAGSRASAYIADFSLFASQVVNAPPPVACVVASSALSSTKSSNNSDVFVPSAPRSATIAAFAAMSGNRGRFSEETRPNLPSGNCKERYQCNL